MRSLFFKFSSLFFTFILAATQVVIAQVNVVDVHFKSQINGLDLSCASLYHQVGLSKASLRLQDFRVFVSAFRWIDSKGKMHDAKLVADGVWQDQSIALLDFEDATGNCTGTKAMNKVVRLESPKKPMSGLVFQIGVPFTDNHQDPTLAAAPLNVAATAWAWRLGYKFTTIDMITMPSKGSMASNSGFSVHLGSTACGQGSHTTPPNTMCLNPNRAEYRFDQFDPSRHSVVLDLGALLASSDITHNAPKSASGCMSFEGDDDCEPIMDGFGLSFRGRASKGQRFVFVK
jgi:uncharacterized repeat protein (TIGR04052 family)